MTYEATAVRRRTALSVFAVAVVALTLSACGGGSSSGGGGGGGGPTTYSIGGTVSGLASGKSVVLQDNGGDNLTVSNNGAFTFQTQVTGAYAVSVLTQPAGQKCSVTSGSSTATANVTSVAVACSTLYSVAASVSGLASGQQVVLLDNGGDPLTVATNGTSTFATSLGAGAAYAVTVKTQPTGQTCTPQSGAGTIAAANVTVQVVCGYTLGGSITGLTGSGLVLQVNRANDQPVTADAGSFTFGGTLSSGTEYLVTVKTQPSGQTCLVAYGHGMIYDNRNNVQIACGTRTSSPLVGTYLVTGSSASGANIGRNVVTFFADGSYVLVNHFGTPCTPKGTTTPIQGGIEYGLYNLDASSGAIAITYVITNTHGDCSGLTNGTGPQTGVTGTLTQSGSTLTLTTAQGGNTSSTTAVPSTSGSLIGSWTSDGRDFAVFFTDNTYVQVTTQASTYQSGASDPAGLEDGCYTLTGTTASGTFTPDLSSSCKPVGLSAIDTNGSTGFSSLVGTAVPFTVSGDMLTVGSGAQNSITATRIVANLTNVPAGPILTGTYNSISYGLVNPGSGPVYYSGSSNDLFAGGNFTSIAGVLNINGTIITSGVSTQTGTYSVLASGSLTLTGSTGGSNPGGVLTADGGAYVVASLAAGSEPGIGVGVRSGIGVTAASVAGNYTIVRLTIGTTSAEDDVQTLTLDASGNFTGPATTNVSGTISTVADFGTSSISVASDGTFLFGNGKAAGAFAADSDLLIIQHFRSGSTPAIEFGVRQGSGETLATLKGNYTVVQFNSGVQGGTAGATSLLGTINTDGQGNYSFSGTQNAGGTLSSQTSQGTYTVQSDGTLRLDGSGRQGAVSADGNVFVLGDVGSGDSPTITVGIRSQ